MQFMLVVLSFSTVDNHIVTEKNLSSNGYGHYSIKEPLEFQIFSIWNRKKIEKDRNHYQ